MSQRKRAMKGCMTVWLIWCCFATYEKTADGIIGIFIPFYSEIKALILLFFILTRARGTEPVYLHILRPMVKPYARPLDSLVELTETFGDLVVLLYAIPYHVLASIYRRIMPRRQPEPTATPPEEHTPKPQEKKAQASKVSTEYQRKSSEPTEHGTVRARRRPLQESHVRARSSQHTNTATGANGVSKHTSEKSHHEIWYPPPAYDESPPNEPSIPDVAIAAANAANMSLDEWRRYEAFPAAYPPTPLPQRVALSVPEMPVPPPLEGITEEQSYYYSYIAEDSVQVEEQGFQESLRLPLSRSEDEDEEMDYEEEDDFDVTLRTPALKRVHNMSNATASSMDRDSNASTEFNTVYGGSPLRTRTNSVASNASNATTTSESDTSSLAGKKRPISSVQESRPLRAPLRDRLPSSQTVRQSRSTIHLNVRPPSAISRAKTSSSASGAENKDAGDDTSSLAPKRRKVAPAKEEGKKDAFPVRRPTVRVDTNAKRRGREENHDCHCRAAQYPNTSTAADGASD
ncbi:hypothetical protein NM688_g6730 [Phlebia brevispora]|uniref:Uncharacterized protein n=1 Tax=Phlebia brevispora TaxID=194682 RepID=A0ACC1SD66_9APHY|nr:hypothetical protein NM688_g6730 [Phlebia brevispora]